MEQLVPHVAPALPPPAYPTLKESWAALGWSILLTFLVGAASWGLLKAAGPALAAAKLALLLSSALVANGLLVLWLRRRAGPGRWLGWRWLGPHESWVAYALLPLLVLANALVLSAQAFLHLPNWSASQFTELAQHPLLALGLGCVAVPLTEEMIFRGALLPGLLRNYRPAVAIGQSALLFGLLHFNPAQSLNAFFLGLLLGWVYYQTRSLLLCACLHGMHNLLAFWGMMWPRLADEQVLLHHPGTGRYLLLVGGAALVLAACLWGLARLQRPLAAPVPQAVTTLPVHTKSAG